MNILVIGNGFDLAHGLPTKYTDFLDFVQIYEECFQKEIKDSEIIKADLDIKKWIRELFDLKYNDSDPIKELENKPKRENANRLIEEIHELFHGNVWIDYFLQCDMHGKENWIDFESEISDVIQSISKGVDENNPRNMYKNVICLENNFFNDKFTNNVPEYLYASVEEQEKIGKTPISYKELRDLLLADLNRMIRAFEIYLTEYVEKIEIQKKLPDIDNLEIDHVLSFNYTNTYEKVYCHSKDIEFDYIHGEANINNTIETNKMVLGIDEYLSGKKKNKKTEFIAFKKFYQRICKQSEMNVKKWCLEIKREAEYAKHGRKFMLEHQIELELVEKDMSSYNRETFEKKAAFHDQEYNDKHPKHQLYIFGHSLDATDKDILRDLILNDNVHTTIFYYNKETMGQQIANLVKVIGQDELIRRTGGTEQLIEFKYSANKDKG